MEDKVIAEVIVRNYAGRSVLDATEPVVAENAELYAVEKARLDEAGDSMQALGFEVVGVGAHSISVTSDQALFEKVFGTKLRMRDAEVSEGVVTAYYTADDSIRVPAELTDLVAAIVLPSPPMLFDQ